MISQGDVQRIETWSISHWPGASHQALAGLLESKDRKTDRRRDTRSEDSVGGYRRRDAWRRSKRSRLVRRALLGLTASQVEQSWLLKSAINPGGKRFVVTVAGHERQINIRRTFYESNHE